MAGIACDDEGLLLRHCVFGNGIKPRIVLSSRSMPFFHVTVQLAIRNEEEAPMRWRLKAGGGQHALPQRAHPRR